MNNNPFSLVDMVFYFTALITVGTASYAVFSKNITRCAFSLLYSFFGMAVLYGLLSADFVAVVQLMIYVGGILVLLLFAVMLTGNIELAANSNKTASRWLGYPLGMVIFVLLVSVFLRVPWGKSAVQAYLPTIRAIGESFLGRLLLPFEFLSIVLLAVVIGAVVIVRNRNVCNASEEEEST
ncbi:MAG: NADH-quinone oxidoreductase subunit J [Fibrobacteria bacterium]|nr:NADH-quinone oxidoreductase subunit J [Fibrobacteria bacterium]